MRELSDSVYITIKIEIQDRDRHRRDILISLVYLAVIRTFILVVEGGFID